tara:strand:+ start:1957 stop:3969 length:2013 start_codon:yes stop_codon:yes gene_type:complete
MIQPIDSETPQARYEIAVGFCNHVQEVIQGVINGNVSILHPHSGRKLSDMPRGFKDSVNKHFGGKGVIFDIEEYYEEKQDALNKSYLKMLETLNSAVIVSDSEHPNQQRYIPKELLLWVVQGFNRMSHFDHKKKKMAARKPSTVRPFLIPDHSYTSQAVCAMQTKLENPQHQFADQKLNNIFKQNKFPTFNVLYTYFYKQGLIEVGDIAEILEVTDGQWEKFNYSQADSLFYILRNLPPLGGDWCIQNDIDMLKDYYLNKGPIYIYFSKAPDSCDDDHIKKYGFPRIFVATHEDEDGVIIGIRQNEIGGVDPMQGMDSIIRGTSHLEELLSSYEFGGMDTQSYLETKRRLDEFNYLYRKYTTNGCVRTFKDQEIIDVLTFSPFFFIDEPDERVLELQEQVLKNSNRINLMDLTINEAYFFRRDLQGVNFGEMTLKDADFSWTNLAGADLSNAGVENADFTGAIVDEETKFPAGFKRISNANGGVIILGPGINVCGSNYFNPTQATYLPPSFDDNINLDKANLRYTRLNIQGYSYSFKGAVFEKVNFHDSLLQQADFTAAYLDEVSFDNCLNIQFALFNNATLNNVSFEGRMLINAEFQSANLKDVNFDGSNLSNTNFESATFNNVSAIGANFWGSNISEEQLNAMKIDTSTKLPDGFRYDENQQKVLKNQ